MKKILLPLLMTAALMLAGFNAKPQLPDGTIAPDFTLVDIYGTQYHMYDYLNAGKTVVLDFSATWCGPCWSYHSSGALETFYNQHGPSGDNTAMVFFIEGDQSTLACIQGTGSVCGNTGSPTQGNWTTGTPYPIIPTYSPNGNTVVSNYSIAYFPTCYMICPADKKTKNVDQYTATQLNTAMAACPSLAYPPVTNFSSLSTQSCRGTIMFADSSTYIPTSWLWNFGDGQTSTLQNPSHTYSTNGTFNVSLTATNAYGSNTNTKNNYITVNLPAAPTTTDGSTVSGGSVTLYASGTGTLNWYDAPTGGNLVTTGTSYTIPSLTSTQTFYVENDVAQSVVSAGMTAKTTNGGYYTSTAVQGDVFNAETPLTIKSVTVYANTTASRTIYLKNNIGTIIDSLVTSISSGTQSVNLNFHVPMGSGYILACKANNSLWRETSGPTYPYTVANIISVTTSTAGTGYYYYFYNWQVQPDPCTSVRTPVTASVIVGIGETDQNISYNLYPNPNTGEFCLNLSSAQNQDISVSIIDAEGKTVYYDQLKVNGTINKKYDFAGYSKGIYFMRIISAENVHNEKIVVE